MFELSPGPRSALGAPAVPYCNPCFQLLETLRSLANKSANSIHTFSVGFSGYLPRFTKSQCNVQKVWGFQLKERTTYRTRTITKKNVPHLSLLFTAGLRLVA